MNSSTIETVMIDLSTPRKSFRCQRCGISVVQPENMDDYRWELYKIGAKYCDDCVDAMFDEQNKTWETLERVRNSEQLKNMVKTSLEQSKIPKSLIEWDIAKGNGQMRFFVDKNRNNSLFVADSYVTCKTRAMCSVAYSMIESGEERDIRFWRMVDLTMHLSSICGQSMGEAEEFIYETRSCGLLILDDVGKEKMTDRVGELVYSILDYRYSHDYKTWITSNYTGNELAKRLGEDRGEAVLRRIRETYLSWQRYKIENKAAS